MDQLPALGTALPGVIAPTMKLYGKLLSANADAIVKTNKTSHTYGPHARHELDVYRPADPTLHDDAPVLLFLHGGGLVRGDRTEPTEPTPGLAWANLGHYFAEECGYVVVVPAYRLVTKHDAAFPSGGEDVALAVQWIKDYLGGEDGPRDLFIMGHSAGGIHAATYLLNPAQAMAVATVVGVRKRQPVRLRGIILLAVPMHFPTAKGPLLEALKTYYGNRMEEDSPLGLLKAFQEKHSGDYPLAGVQVLVIDSTLDPDEEVRGPTTAFLGQWLQSPSQAMKDHILYREVEAHNHLSLVWALGTGIEKEEAWADEVSGFIESIRRRDQVQRDLKILQESMKRLPVRPSKANEAKPAAAGVAGEKSKAGVADQDTETTKTQVEGEEQSEGNAGSKTEKK